MFDFAKKKKKALQKKQEAKKAVEARQQIGTNVPFALHRPYCIIMGV